MGAVALDDRAGAGVPKSNARKLRSRKHFGNASSHFLEETTVAKENRLRNRVTANNSISNNRSNNANRGRSVNLNQSK
jgi:hypothetical protein